jgi:hypothetical protein
MPLWSEFRPWIAPEIKEAPNSIIDSATRLTVIDFCEHTRCWQEPSTGYTTGIGTYVYTFAGVSNQGEPWIIMRGRIGVNQGRRLTHKPQEWCDENFPGWDTGISTGQPCYTTQTEPGYAFYLVPTPQAVEPFVLTLSVKPKHVAEGCPQFILNDHHDAIVAGTKARLMGMGGDVPWANPKLAAVYSQVYLSARDMAHTRVAKAFGRGTHRVRAHYF